MLILVEWYGLWQNCRTPLYCPSFTTEVVFLRGSGSKTTGGFSVPLQ